MYYYFYCSKLTVYFLHCTPTIRWDKNSLCPNAMKMVMETLRDVLCNFFYKNRRNQLINEAEVTKSESTSCHVTEGVKSKKRKHNLHCETRLQWNLHIYYKIKYSFHSVEAREERWLSSSFVFRRGKIKTYIIMFYYALSPRKPHNTNITQYLYSKLRKEGWSVLRLKWYKQCITDYPNNHQDACVYLLIQLWEQVWED